MNRRKKTLLCVLCVFCAVGGAVSGWGLYKELKPRVEAENSYTEARELAFPDGRKNGQQDGTGGAAGAETQPERGAPDWKALKAWNPDICGWIYGPGTTIDYPVVQGTDNNWYLNHTADKKRSMIGSIFLDSGNRADFGDDVSVLYGHHIRGGRMFTPISGYKKQKYYEEHPVMYLYTPEADYRIELFAGRILNGSTGSFPLKFADEKAREGWLKQLQAGSTFHGAAGPVPGERILALCTCTYEYQDARYAVYGIMKKLEIEEKKDDERRTHDERDSENNSADAVLPDDVSNPGNDSAG